MRRLQPQSEHFFTLQNVPLINRRMQKHVHANRLSMLFQSIAAYQLLLTLQKDTPLQFPYPTTNNAHKSVAAPKNSNLASLNVLCLLSIYQMQTLLTLFSKLFSFFLHGTCLLTVSSFLFIFTWDLPPFLHSIPKKRDSANAHSARRTVDGKQEYHPCCCSASRSVHPGPHWQCIPTLQLKAWSPNYKNEPTHVHSQLLLAFQLVSTPLPTYMLKFSRFASQNSMPCDRTQQLHANTSVINSWAKRSQSHCKSHVKWHSLTQHLHKVRKSYCINNTKAWIKPTFKHIPKLHNAFNMQFVHGHLQFTVRTTCCCILYRHLSQNIHHWCMCYPPGNGDYWM